MNEFVRAVVNYFLKCFLFTLLLNSTQLSHRHTTHVIDTQRHTQQTHTQTQSRERHTDTQRHRAVSDVSALSVSAAFSLSLCVSPATSPRLHVSTCPLSINIYQQVYILIVYHIYIWYIYHIYAGLESSRVGSWELGVGRLPVGKNPILGVFHLANNSQSHNIYTLSVLAT